MSAALELRYSFEDYLEIESSGEKKYEFYDGELFEVENASINHNRVLANSFGKIAAFLEGNTCEPFAANLKVHVKRNSLTSFPDITIVCGPLETLKGYKDIVTNPAVIFEIIAASTGDYDHGTKFQLYRDLPSLKEYILIDSRKMLVEKFTKQDNSVWTMHEYKKPEDVLTIVSVGFQMPLSDIYHNIDFSLSGL